MLAYVKHKDLKEALDRAYATLADRDAEIANNRAEITRLQEMLLAQGYLVSQN